MSRAAERPRLPLRPCHHCGTPFAPRQRLVNGVLRTPQHCSNVCARQTIYAANKGKPCTQAILARSAKQRAIREQALRRRYGYLSPREIDLMIQAEAHGYDRGYNVAYRRVQKAKAS